MSFSQVSRPNGQGGPSGLIYYESPQLRSLSFLIHAFTTRHGGVSAGCYRSLNFGIKERDPKENVQANLKIVADTFDLSPRQFLTVSQVHGDDMLIIDHPAFSPPADTPLKYDGIITNQPGLAIGIKSADCVPILIVDRVKRVIAAVHAGWRGTALRIAAKAVEQMRVRFSSETDDLTAAIGPAIGPCCYQVDRPVYRAMSADREGNRYFRSCGAGDHWMLDLPDLNRHHLVAAGCREENIDMSGLCTSCFPDLFYSHRGESGKTGRHLNFLMIRENI